MFFPDDEPEVKRTNPEKIICIYENGSHDSKPIEFKLHKSKNGFKEIKNLLNFIHLRLFNSEGAEYFEDDIEFIKNRTVLYASNGEDFDPASCFGEYEIIKKLGEGGFGQVLLARHKQTGEEFAIKIIKTDRVGSAADIDGIFVEAQTLKSLKNDNIVKVYNCLTLKNMQVAIIMEYLEGGQLLEFVKKQGRLSEETARVFFKQIVKAMNYCHSNGLIHRDLKLENMLLVNKEERKIKIIDFGIAGVMNSLTWQDLDIGSLGYMAPECFVNKKGYKVDGRIDVWATGVILYAMLVGELPFQGNSNKETIEIIKTGKYKFPSKIAKQLSPQCLDIVSHCLDPNPLTRVTMEDLSSHSWLSGDFFQQKKKVDLVEVVEQEQAEVAKPELKKGEKSPSGAQGRKKK